MQRTIFVIFLAVFSFIKLSAFGLNRTESRLTARRDQNDGVDLALRKELLTDYRRDISSYGQDGNNDDIINMSYHITKIINLDEKAEQLAVAFYVDIIWTDRRLTWELSEFNLSFVEMIVMDIWYPNIIHSNSVYQKNEIMDKNQRITVTFGGVVTWSGTLILTSPCEKDVTYFPVDRQVCELQLRLAPRQKQPRLFGKVTTAEAAVDTKYYEDSTWRLSEYRDVNITNPTDPSPYTMKIHIKLQRKYRYYVNRILAPVTLLAVLVVVSFFIPPDAGEKIGFGVTLLLTFSVFQTMIDEDLPASSDSTPILSTGVVPPQIRSTTSITAAAIVPNWHHLGSEYGGRMPGWPRFLFFTILAEITFHTSAVKIIRRDRQETKTRACQIEPTPEKVAESERPETPSEISDDDTDIVELARNEWKVAAPTLDRLLMYICLSAVVGIYITLLLQLMDQYTSSE